MTEKPIYNPSTGEVLTYQKLNTLEEFKKAVRDARAAQEVWGKNACT